MLSPMPIATQTAKLPREKRPPQMYSGHMVADAALLPPAENGTFFYYQFVHSTGDSRVLACENEKERAGLARKIESGAKVRVCLPYELFPPLVIKRPKSASASRTRITIPIRENGRAPEPPAQVTEPAKAAPKPRSTALLMGDKIVSAEMLRHEFERRGPFSYQALTKPPSVVAPCDNRGTLEALIDLMKKGTAVTIRR